MMTVYSRDSTEQIHPREEAQSTNTKHRESVLCPLPVEATPVCVSHSIRGAQRNLGIRILTADLHHHCARGPIHKPDEVSQISPRVPGCLTASRQTKLLLAGLIFPRHRHHFPEARGKGQRSSGSSLNTWLPVLQHTVCFCPVCPLPGGISIVF